MKYKKLNNLIRECHVFNIVSVCAPILGAQSEKSAQSALYSTAKIFSFLGAGSYNISNCSPWNHEGSGIHTSVQVSLFDEGTYKVSGWVSYVKKGEDRRSIKHRVISTAFKNPTVEAPPLKCFLISTILSFMNEASLLDVPFDKTSEYGVEEWFKEVRDREYIDQKEYSLLIREYSAPESHLPMPY